MAQARRTLLVLASALALWWQPVPVSAAADAGSLGAARRDDQPLPELPKVDSLAPSTPKKDDLAALDGLLDRLRSRDPHIRKTALREILEAAPGLVPAIDHRLNAIAEKADRGEMKKTMRAIRKKGRKAERERMRAAGKRGKVVTPDYLEMAVEFAQPESQAWKDLVAVLGMSRLLRTIGSVQAGRTLIDIYVRFGEFLRADTQLQLQEMGSQGVAALIEARRHDAKKIANWAERQLDLMGKAIPSEAVQTDDHDALADVLRAYGRTRDPDAARIIISFANSERAQVRLAARQAVAMLGEVGAWQLRDTYENVVGKKPPRDWSWERTARELFWQFDRLRLARVFLLFEKGLAAQRSEDLEAMRQAYDAVLAQSPSFERRSEMAPGYFAFAQKVADEDLEAAIVALERARRVADDDSLRARATSLLFTLQGEKLLAENVADQTLFRRAIELDPNNQRARDALDLAERGDVETKTALYRYGAAGAIGLVALLAIAFIGLRRPKRDATEPEQDAAGGDARDDGTDGSDNQLGDDASATPNDDDGDNQLGDDATAGDNRGSNQLGDDAAAGAKRGGDAQDDGTTAEANPQPDPDDDSSANDCDPQPDPDDDSSANDCDPQPEPDEADETERNR